jgi:hypothetical protein
VRELALLVSRSILRPSKLIITDWDGTCQNTNTKGVKGPFNSALIALLKARILQGTKVAIVTAGNYPSGTMHYLEELTKKEKLSPLDLKIHVADDIMRGVFTNAQMLEKLLKKNMLSETAKEDYDKIKDRKNTDLKAYNECCDILAGGKFPHSFISDKVYQEYSDNYDDAANALFVLKNSYHFYHARKSLDWDKTKYTDIDRLYSSYTPNSAPGTWLFKLIKENSGYTPVFANDGFDQEFVYQLKKSKVLSELADKPEFELIRASMKGCFDFETAASIKKHGYRMSRAQVRLADFIPGYGEKHSVYNVREHFRKKQNAVISRRGSVDETSSESWREKTAVGEENVAGRKLRRSTSFHV